MSVKLLNEHRLEFLNLEGGYTCLSESTRVKIPRCWKSHVAAHIITSPPAAAAVASTNQKRTKLMYKASKLHSKQVT